MPPPSKSDAAPAYVTLRVLADDEAIIAKLDQILALLTAPSNPTARITIGAPIDKPATKEG